ncbi:MAG: response regulator [Magnetococcales bacterium]|nr:response regulator [Magnetococcales bacterium]
MTAREKTYLTTSEVARLFGVAAPTIHDWIERGLLKAWKTPGGHRRISRQSVEELHKRHAKDSGQEESSEIHLLLVEDDPDMVLLIKKEIKRLDQPIRISTADNGFDGLMMIGEYKPDIIISDLAMPGMNGFEMIRAIRETPALRNTYIVVLTALESEEIQKEAPLPSDVPVVHKSESFDRITTLIRQRAGQLNVA